VIEVICRLVSIACRAASASCVALILSSVVSATVLVPVALPELTADATVVVRGIVVATEARWLEGRRGIETVVTLAASDYVKGNLGRSLTFRVPGGQMGPYRSFMVGAPVFRQGDDVVLFLKASGAEVPHVVGFNQGVYRVRADSKGGPVVALHGMRDAPRTLAVGARNGNPVDGRAASAFEPLPVFLARLRTFVTDGAGR
jgi:hypothetical protein